MTFETLRFFWTALRDREVGSFVPTSMVTVRSICSQIETARPVTIVEYGAGTGVFTRYLLDRLHPDSTIVAIERNIDFARQLARLRSSASQPELLVDNADAARVARSLSGHGISKVDYVLSGIPFSFLEERQRKRIIRSTWSVLKPQGRFIVYQTSGQLKPLLRERFGNVKERVCLLNVPPLHVLESVKRVASLEGKQAKNGRNKRHSRAVRFAASCVR